MLLDIQRSLFRRVSRVAYVHPHIPIPIPIFFWPKYEHYPLSLFPFALIFIIVLLMQSINQRSFLCFFTTAVSFLIYSSISSGSKISSTLYCTNFFFHVHFVLFRLFEHGHTTHTPSLSLFLFSRFNSSFWDNHINIFPAFLGGLCQLTDV